MATDLRAFSFIGFSCFIIKNQKQLLIEFYHLDRGYEKYRKKNYLIAELK